MVCCSSLRGPISFRTSTAKWEGRQNILNVTLYITSLQMFTFKFLIKAKNSTNPLIVGVKPSKALRGSEGETAQ